MNEGCKKCSHYDEQIHLDQEDKVDTSPEHLPDAENEKLTELLTICGKYPEEFNKIGNILYGFFGHPIGAETQLLCTYVYLKMKEKEGEE